MDNKLEEVVLKTIDNFRNIIDAMESNSLSLKNVYDYISLIKIRMHLINMYYCYKGILLFENLVSSTNIRNSVNTLSSAAMFLYTNFKESKESYTFQSKELETCFDESADYMLYMIQELKEKSLMNLQKIKNIELENEIKELCKRSCDLIIACRQTINNMKEDIVETFNDVLLLEKLEAMFYDQYELFIGLYHITSKYTDLLSDKVYCSKLSLTLKSFYEIVDWINEKYNNRDNNCEYNTTEKIIELSYTFSTLMENFLEENLQKNSFNY